MKVLIIGCGYLGQTLAKSLKDKTTLSVTKQSAANPPLDCHLVLLKGSTYRKLQTLIKDYDALIITAAAKDRQDYSLSYLSLARQIKKALREHPGKTLIYTSSTGVYEESSGQVVDELSPLDINQSQILIQTEKTYLSIPSTRIVIMRLSGLFGEQGPLKELYGRYKQIPMYPRFSNFIEVHEAAYAIRFALFNPIRGIFNVSNLTVKNTDLFETLFNTKPLISNTSPNTSHGGSKQVSSVKLQSQPGFKFQTV